MYTLVKKIDCGEFRVVGLMRMDLRWGGGGGGRVLNGCLSIWKNKMAIICSLY